MYNSPNTKKSCVYNNPHILPKKKEHIYESPPKKKNKKSSSSPTDRITIKRRQTTKCLSGIIYIYTETPICGRE